MAEKSRCPKGKVRNPLTGRCVNKDNLAKAKAKSKAKAQSKSTSPSPAVNAKKPKKAASKKKAVKAASTKKTKPVKTQSKSIKSPPPEDDPLRIFYTSLLRQNPDSKLAQAWMKRHGLD